MAWHECVWDTGYSSIHIFNIGSSRNPKKLGIVPQIDVAVRSEAWLVLGKSPSGSNDNIISCQTLTNVAAVNVNVTHFSVASIE